MKTIEECLDIILRELVKNWDKPNNEREFLSSKDILTKFDLPDTMQKAEFFKRLIFRLVNDGYAEFNTHLQMDRNSHLNQFEDYPLITIEGHYFIKKQNGYTQEKQDKITLLAAAEDRNQRMERNEVRLTRWTKRLFYGTIVAALILVTWEIVKTFCLEK